MYHRTSTSAQFAQIIATLNNLEKLMTQQTTDEQHLDADVTALTTAIGTEVAELKAAIAAGTPAAALDFTALDNLLTATQAEATADAPPVPPVPPVA